MHLVREEFNNMGETEYCRTTFSILERFQQTGYSVVTLRTQNYILLVKTKLNYYCE